MWSLQKSPHAKLTGLVLDGPIGGLDVVIEMAEEGDLKGQLGLSEGDARSVETIQDTIRKLISRSRVMLFMKVSCAFEVFSSFYDSCCC